MPTNLIFLFSLKAILQFDLYRSAADMVAVLASHSCLPHNCELMIQGRTMDALSFSTSISNPIVKFERRINDLPMADKSFRFQVEMQQTESSPKVGINGRAVKMVPASEVMNRKTPASGKVEKVNGVKQVINGASIVKRDASPAIVKTPKSRVTEELPPLESSKVLPSDENFSWANENYNTLQRTIDVWSFVLSFRVRVLLDNAKWTYGGGFTEEKQVRSYLTNIHNFHFYCLF